MRDNIESLTAKLEQKLSVAKANTTYDLSRYNWENIARQTFEVYQSVLE